MYDKKTGFKFSVLVILGLCNSSIMSSIHIPYMGFADHNKPYDNENNNVNEGLPELKDGEFGICSKVVYREEETYSARGINSRKIRDKKGLDRSRKETGGSYYMTLVIFVLMSWIMEQCIYKHVLSIRVLSRKGILN